MAGDWIPMRCDLADDPAVIAIAGATGLDEHAVVGRLHRLWSWANTHLTDGNATGVTAMWVDRYLGCMGFGAAMAKSGWLTETPDGIEFPKFDRWNSQGAKKRALTARRVANHKLMANALGNAEGNAHSVSVALPTVQDSTDQTPIPPPGVGGGNKSTTKTKSSRRRDVDEHPRFDSFWSSYPRKENRKKAAEAFSRVAPDDNLFGVMMAALEAQKHCPKWTKDSGQFVPHASTWLNGQRWKDELPPATAPAKPTSKTITSDALDPTIYGPAPGGSR